MDALIEPSWAHEEVAPPSDVTPLFERAPAVPWTEQGSIETGRVPGRMGSRAAKAARRDRVFAAHVLAAREANESGMTKACGSSLSAAGSTLVAFPPDEALGHIVDEELAWTAFHGVVEQARETLLGGRVPTLANALKVHHHFADLVALSAFAGLEAAPLGGSKSLFDTVICPFSELHYVRICDGRPEDEAYVIASEFENLARLSSCVAEQGRRSREGVAATGEAAATMVEVTAETFAGSVRQRTLRWLGVYLRDHRGASWATDERIDALADGRARRLGVAAPPDRSAAVGSDDRSRQPGYLPSQLRTASLAPIRVRRGGGVPSSKKVLQ